MEAKDWINIAAIIVIPIVAVLIGQYLQNRAKKREDKLQIFKTLMTARIYGWTKESINALNIIDVIYVNDKSVRDAWAKLFELYCNDDKSDIMSKKRKDSMYKLLEDMSKSLGYGKKIDWQTIQNPYIPQVLQDELQKEEVYKNGQLALALFMQDLNSKNNCFNSHSSTTTEEKHEK